MQFKDLKFTTEFVGLSGRRYIKIRSQSVVRKEGTICTKTVNVICVASPFSNAEVGLVMYYSPDKEVHWCQR